MKINKMIIFIITIIFVMSFSTSYAASKVPSADASASKIVKYVKENDISSIGIKKLVAWYKTCVNETTTAAKIDSALKSKSASKIKEYVDSVSDGELLLIPNGKGILEKWTNTCGGSSDAITASRLDDIRKQTDSEAVADPTLNPNTYRPSNATSTKIEGLVGPILGAIQAIGSIVSVIALAIIGVKYMLGSVEQKANYKQTLLPYLIGAIILFTGSTLPNIIYQVIK